jgi:hypothetical protein
MAVDLKSKNTREPGQPGKGRYVAVAAVIALAFVLSYGYASAARSSSPAPAWAGGQGVQSAQASGTGAAAAGAGGNCCGGTAAAGSSAGSGCCGSGGSQTAVKGATKVAGGVQKVTIDLTTGSYSPNEITAKAGVPLELVFKGPASGCNGSVQSQDLGFQQDVSNGGTIKVGALKPGTYSFACSMNMYTAKISVK